LPPSDEGVPATQTRAPGAEQLGEERPLRNSPLEYTRANLRYCTFQQIRLEALGPITEGTDLVVFNALVEDWNGRCTKNRYRAEDKEAVDAEAGRRRALLEVEGRALMNVWRRKIVTTVEQSPAFATPDVSETVAAAPEQTGDMDRLPSLITLGRATAEGPERDIGLSLRTPSLALMRAEVAMRVQRRLNDLGYTIAVDGTWGTASRAVLRRFKKANGLLGNDAFDAETATRLFSTLAMAAPPGRKDDETATTETVYPPPLGADMNPLNRADGQRIQQRLAELGYYTGRGDGTWDAAARAALRKFKTASGLGNNEDWDLPCETVLFDEQAVRAADAVATAPRRPVAPPTATVPLPPKRPAPPGKTAGRAGK
jgi:peptidoglycan hydrolase-like protein with peptidoglycan-binding domain